MSRGVKVALYHVAGPRRKLFVFFRPKPEDQADPFEVHAVDSDKHVTKVDVVPVEERARRFFGLTERKLDRGQGAGGVRLLFPQEGPGLRS